MTTKQCTKCNQTLPTTSFYCSSKYRDGLRVWCIECESASRRAYRSTHLEEQRTKLRNNYYRFGRHSLDVNHHDPTEPAVYLLTVGDALYVGSTKHLQARLHTHRSMLRNGTHTNHALQDAYEGSDGVVEAITVAKGLTKSERSWLEEKLILALGVECCNVYLQQEHTNA